MEKGVAGVVLVGVVCGLAAVVPACSGGVECGATGTCSSPQIDGGPDASEEASALPEPAPVIAAIDTQLGDTGGGTPITIRGEHFLGATGATLGGVPVTTFLVANDKEITAVTGPHAKGVVDLVVTAPASSATAAGVFEYFNPTSIAGCVWWLRADLGVSTTDSEVTLWADQSGLEDPGRSAVPRGTDRPLWNQKDPKYNNKATVGTFNKAGTAGDCGLRTNVWRDIYSAPGGTKALSLGLVGHADSSSIRYFVFAANADYVALAGVNAQPTAYAGNGSALLQKAASVTDTPKTFLMAEFNGASSKLYVNATVTASATGNLGTTTTLGDEPMHVGSYFSTATTYGVERIAEVFAYGRVLSDAEKAKLRTYLNLRYDKTMTE